MSDDENEDDAPIDKKKSEKYMLVPADDLVWKTLKKLVGKVHTKLAGASIALVWEFGIKPDADGVTVLGRAKKTSPLERQFREDDFTILLNGLVWPKLPKDAKEALLDHELSHCVADEDDDGKTVYRLRKHDLEEFVDVVKRHGIWREGIKTFIDAANNVGQPASLFPEPATTGEG